MSFNKVAWSEGLFLQPQHFQQEQRYFESCLSELSELHTAYHWGVVEFRLDNTLSRQGKIGVQRARAVFPDGTHVDIPGRHASPPLLELSDSVKNEILYIGIPLKRTGVSDIAAQNSTTMSRYLSVEESVLDSVTPQGTSANIELAEPNFRFLLESQDRSGFSTIPIARIIEVKGDRTIVLDDNFIPPCLDITASERLKNFLTELSGLLHHRAEALAVRTSDGNRMGTAEVADYLLLMVINRYTPLINHYITQPLFSALEFYKILIQLAGELSTFSNKSRRPVAFLPFSQNALQECFYPVINSLRQSLSAVVEQTALAIPFVLRNYGIRVAAISDRGLIGKAFFVMAVKADRAGEEIRQLFPNVSKLGPVENIRDMINLQLPGIKLNPLPVAPRQIPYHSGFTYFEVDRSSDYWKAMQTSGGFALHVGDGFPGLEIEFWAIRE